ncbi:MAG: hypothetical protein JWP00_3680 [Chloroflexi bacterium]|jgi:hypothetical protein|nr:hypothetical protein [Chloroflexota bacterium]
MKIIRLTGFLLLNMVIIKLFSADRRGAHNNPSGLPSDVSNLPGGGTTSGEVTAEGGDAGSVSLVGSGNSDEKGAAPPQTAAATDPVGDLGWMATGTPGEGGEIGEAARKAQNS